MNPTLDVEVPFAQGRVEVQAVDGNPDLGAPACRRPLRGRLPDAIPIGVLRFAARVDQTVVASTAGIDREHVPGAAVTERTQHHAHVILGVERRVATHAEADDARRFRIVADDADHEGLRSGQHPHAGAAARHRAFDGIGLREIVGRLSASPLAVVDHAIDAQRRGQRSGAQRGRRGGLRAGEDRTHHTQQRAHKSAAPAYFQVISMPKKCRNTSRVGLFFGFCCGLRM